jgi:hypothetical protein
MNRIAESMIAALVLALGLCVPGRVAAATLVPFGGTVNEQFSVTPCAGCRIVSITGTGEFLHLGTTSEVSTVDTNTSQPLGDGCFSETRTTTLTAANGDQLDLYATGVSCPNNTSSDQWSVVGGTGRFAGASGSGSETGTRTFISLTPPSGVATLTYSGSMSSPGAAT